MNKVNLSVITVCYNAEKDIENTIYSVLQQDYSEFEYIIVDGASTDQTINIIKSYEDKFYKRGVWFRYFSEKDYGIYHAMNKGVKLSYGKWIHFLNAGDVFADITILRKMFTIIKNSSLRGVVYGDYYKKHSNELVLCKAKEISEILDHMCFCHQAAVTEREYLLQYPFDEKYKIVADHDLFIKLYLKHIQFSYIPICVAIFDCCGVSQTNIIQLKKEEYLVKRESGNISETKKIMNWFILKGECFYIVVRSIRNKFISKIGDKNVKKD